MHASARVARSVGFVLVATMAVAACGSGGDSDDGGGGDPDTTFDTDLPTDVGSSTPPISSGAQVRFLNLYLPEGEPVSVDIMPPEAVTGAEGVTP